jgi:predicted aspartyl protease
VSRFAFQPGHGPILVDAEMTGPRGTLFLNLVLDTGATTSLINLTTAQSLGFDPDQSTHRIPMVTGSTIELVPVVVLTRLTVLGQHRFGFPVIAHALPARSAVDGLLGLDFFRNQSLTVDFRAGWISLA